MVIGFMIEAPLGSFRMLLFFLISVIGGNLFGCMLSPRNAIGPEPFIFAIFAGLLGMIVVYWDKLGENVSRKVCILFIMVFIMVIGIMFLNAMAQDYAIYSLKNNLNYPDTQASLGGFLFGLFAIFMLLPSVEYGFMKGDSRSRTLTVIGIVGVISLFAICASLFFTADAVKDYSNY